MVNNSLLHETKMMLQLALPLLAAMLSQKGMQLIDTIMLGQLGIYALAAGALGITIFMTILVFCIGTLSAIGIYIARAIGANELNDIKINLHQGFYLAFLLMIPGMWVLWQAPNFLLWIGEDTNVVAATTTLLRGFIIAVPGVLCFLVLREFVAAFSLTRIIMMITFFALPLTYVANITLIYGKWGFPALGIAGIGYAIAIVQWSMFFSLLIYCLWHPRLKTHLRNINWRQTHWQIMWDMARIGVPSGMILILDVGMCLIAVIMMGYFGETALAAHQIAIQCSSIAFTFPFAISIATALRVGNAMGAKNMLQAKQATYIGLTLGIAISVIIAFLFFFIPHWFVQVFVSNTEEINGLYAFASKLLMIAAFFQCADAVQIILNGALRGFKDTFVPMILSIICYWVLGVGSAYYLTFYTSIGVFGAWYGLTLGVCSAGFALSWRYARRFKREKERMLQFAAAKEVN